MKARDSTNLKARGQCLTLCSIVQVAAVVVGFDRNISYYKIQYATLCIRENPGCKFIATNLDAVTHLTDAQEWAGNGSMVGAIKGEPPPVRQFFDLRNAVCMAGRRLLGCQPMTACIMHPPVQHAHRPQDVALPLLELPVMTSCDIPLSAIKLPSACSRHRAGAVQGRPSRSPSWWASPPSSCWKTLPRSLG